MGSLVSENAEFERLDRKRLPSLTAQVAKEARAFRPEPRVLRKVREDQREMLDLSDHRMRLIGLALLGPALGMRMNIGDDLELSFGATLPQRVAYL